MSKNHSKSQANPADISYIKQAQDILAERAALMENAQDAIFVVDERCAVTYWNRSAERLLGWTAQEASDISPIQLFDGGAEVVQEIVAAIDAEGAWAGNVRYLHKDGTPVEMAARMSTFAERANSSARPKVLAINTDLSLSRAWAQKFHRVALFDNLTGLPNRSHLLRRLRGLRRAAKASPAFGALIVVDLNHFKAINDLRGRRTGDRLLRAIGQRLQAMLPDPHFVARIGGDEFALICSAEERDFNRAAQAAEKLAAQIQLELLTSFEALIGKRRLKANIGIAVFERASIDIADLLAQADSALSNARAQPDLRISFYDAATQQAAVSRMHREEELRSAIDQKQFALHFQPQMNSAGELIGAEALLRWNHSRRGMVHPREFIALAEETGLIHALGGWVLEEACRKLVAWRACLSSLELPLSINVSAVQFAHPAFTDMVLGALERSGADPRLLKLELTESLFVEDLNSTADKMNLLRSHGVTFSLDDFGTGFAALSYLKKLPLAQLKIDISFVTHIATSAHDAAIVRSIVTLGESLGISVIAEGVETQDQQRSLAECGCLEYQGFLFEKAICEEKFLHYLEKHAAATEPQL